MNRRKFFSMLAGAASAATIATQMLGKLPADTPKGVLTSDQVRDMEAAWDRAAGDRSTVVHYSDMRGAVLTDDLLRRAEARAIATHRLAPSFS